MGLQGSEPRLPFRILCEGGGLGAGGGFTLTTATRPADRELNTPPTMHASPTRADTQHKPHILLTLTGTHHNLLTLTGGMPRPPQRVWESGTAQTAASPGG